jgi:hypothetical protein
VLLGHKHRSRLVRLLNSSLLFFRLALLTGTMLIDGFVGARWSLARVRTNAILTVDTFGKVTRKERRAIEEEGQRLLSFAAADADDRDVRFLARR